MDDIKYLVDSIQEIKQMLNEMKKEIREDINMHKKENETDILRLYDMIGSLKEKMTVLDTEYNSFRKLSNLLLVGVAGAIIASIMTMILK